MKEQTKGEMQLSLYKFMCWLGSCCREIQNKRAKNIPYNG